ncbi:MAG TPA: hypothetical protein VKZ82_22870 [Nonomuraea sp.]|nr:hypothetical protein [Nonomuraea sp.]
MNTVKNVNFCVTGNPSRGYEGTLTCPAPGCGATATVTSRSKEGPYTGSCSNGHGLSCPSAKAGPAPV